jgi:hypothetical protein
MSAMASQEIRPVEAGYWTVPRETVASGQLRKRFGQTRIKAASRHRRQATEAGHWKG